LIHNCRKINNITGVFIYFEYYYFFGADDIDIKHLRCDSVYEIIVTMMMRRMVSYFQFFDFFQLNCDFLVLCLIKNLKKNKKVKNK